MNQQITVQVFTVDREHFTYAFTDINKAYQFQQSVLPAENVLNVTLQIFAEKVV